MEQAGWSIAGECTVEYHASVTSTNLVALERARAGERRALWLVAGEQTAGRGRHGRGWHSPVGNLYASRLVVQSGPVGRFAELGFVAGIAVHQAASGLLGESGSAIALKWPNDLVANGGKLAGVLVESETIGAEVASAVGTGLNLLVTSAEQATASIADLGGSATPATAFAGLAAAFEDWLAVWDGGKGFARIRGAWLDRALPVGAPTTVRIGEERLEGRFEGIDHDGALLLATGAGEVRRIAAGEVMTPGASG